MADTVQSSSWINDWIKSQQQVNANQDAIINSIMPGPAAAIGLQTRNTVGVGNHAANMILSGEPVNYTPGAIPLDDVSGSPSWLARAIDVVERPLYAAGNVVESIIQQAEGKPHDSFWESVGQGLSGKQKTDYIEALKNGGVNNTLANVVGFGADLFLDPANALLGPLGKGAVEGVKAVTGARAATKLGTELRDTVEVAGGANKPNITKTVPSTTPSVSDITPVAGPVSNAPVIQPTLAESIAKAPEPIPDAASTVVNPDVAAANPVPLPVSNALDDVVKAQAKIDALQHTDENPLLFTVQKIRRSDGSVTHSQPMTHSEAVAWKSSTDTRNAAGRVTTGSSFQRIVPVDQPRYDALEAAQKERNTAIKAARQAPKPEEVKAAAEAIPEDLAGQVTAAAKAAPVIDNKVPDITMEEQHLTHEQQLKNVRKETPVIPETDPKTYNESVANSVVDLTNADDTLSLTKGQSFDVDGHNLGLSDVFELTDASKHIDTIASETTRLTSSAFLKMGAAALDAKAAGMDTGRMTATIYNAGERALKESGLSDAKIAGKTQSLKSVASNLSQNADRLVERVAANDETVKNAIQNAAALVAKETGDKLAKDLSFETGHLADAVDDLANTGGLVDKSAKGNKKVRDAAAPVVAESVAKATTKGDVDAAKAIKKNKQTWEAKQTSKGRKMQKAIADDARRARTDMEEARLNALSVIPANLPIEDQASILLATEVNQIAQRSMNPIKSLFGTFARLGRQIALDAVAGRASGVRQIFDFNNAIAAIGKKYTKEDLKIATEALKTGRWPKGNAEAMAATRELVPHMQFAGFDMSHMGKGIGDPLKGSMWAQGWFSEDIHRYMKDAGMNEKNFIPTNAELEKWRKANPEKTDREFLADWWRNSDIDNVIDFMGRAHTAKVNIATMSGIAYHFADKFGSTVQHEGWIRMPQKLEVPGGSRIWQYVPKVDADGKIIYVHPEAAKWLAHVEHQLAMATGMTQVKGPITNFIFNTMDPLMATWKTMVTIARPGFLVRNFTGDVSLNMLGGVYSPKWYKDGFQMMKAAGSLSKPTIEAMNALLTKPSDVTEVGKWTMTVHLKNGKKEVVNDVGSAGLAYQHGVTPSYRSTADQIEVQSSARKTNAPQKVYNRVQRNKYIQMASLGNEAASHLPRLAQFSKLMQDPKFTSKFYTLDEAAAAAAAEVRRYHPDVTELSPGGQTIMRRIMPFYAWTRLVTPIALETLLTKPNRLTAIPKAYYAVNTAAGGQPDSISDMFPPTMLVPDWVRENLGYVGGDSTFNLGTPIESLGGTFPGNTTEDIMRSTVYGNLSPVIKTPIDLLSGNDQERGSKILDKSDYLDSALGLTPVRNLTGVSPLGSINKIVTGQGLVDPMRQVAQGNRSYLDWRATTNFMTGIGLSNFKRPAIDYISQQQINSGQL
jgi:hypothetical protein